MNTEEFKRRLTAILSADVEGYSRLMREDEEATIRTLKTYRTAMRDLIRQYRGRVVDSPGDNILAEFASVLDAVNCAVEIQRELAERNTELPENRRMQFRIGVNLGDIVEDGERIYGDGVNIAARMESLAQGGGICISGKVYEEVKHKLGLEYEYQGEQEVKNIPEPVQAYKVLSFPGAAAHRVIKAKRAVGKTWRNVVVAIAAVLVVGAALAVWHFYFRPPPIEPASVERMAYPLPDKPSIAVLPFVNMSGDPEQEYIADGICESIITALGKIPEMFVIARTSTFTYKDKPVKVQQVSEELGVRYVLEGSVRKAEDRVRITAQLIDATTGHHLWSERYDRDLRDIFALQDEITIKIITALQVELTEGEQARIRQRSTNNLQAWGYAIKGYSLYSRYTKGDNAKARELFEKAIKLDPEYAWAWTCLAWTHYIDVRFGYSKSPAESFKQAVKIVQKALALDETDPDVHSLLGGIYMAQRQYEKAIAEGRRAVDLGPNSAQVHALFSMWLGYSGEFEEGLAAAEKAIRLSPHYPSFYLLALGFPKLYLGRYDEAIEPCKRALERAKKEGEEDILIISHIYLAHTYSELDREKEARTHIEEILKINPKFSLEWVRNFSYFKNPEHLERRLSALRKAGLK
jgi:TolB-like protein/class 3 adenylate cyclase/Flp pilus assembly protein TadD